MMNAVRLFTPVVEAVVSHICEGVVITEADGHVIYHNKAAAKLLGMDEIETVHQISNRLNQTPQQQFPRKLNNIQHPQKAISLRVGATDNFEHKLTNNGITRFIEFTSSSIDIPGERERSHLLVLRDVTESHRLEAVFQDSLNCGMLTQDPTVLDICARIDQVACTRAPVLLQGESGTGKTLLARLIHKKGQRSNKPLVEVNCAAIPEALMESEMFGHVKGAFTGAVSERPGRFQAADGGTLFLDEISEIPLHLQPKLLKALEEQQFQMVGSDSNINVDIHIIAASNQNLRKMVDEGSFRADLYYRLAVMTFDIPPLQDRPGDIPLLIRHICDQLVSRGYPDGLECTSETMAMMLNYPWPGNVRELANAVEHAVILANNDVVCPRCLPINIRKHWESLQEQNDVMDDADLQRKEISDAIDSADGNRAEAARLLGIDRSTLWRRMHRFGMISN